MRALDLKGLPLGEAPFTFKAADRETEARFDLPVEIRNDIARIEISGERSAGAVQLLDKRWRRRTVGIVSGAIADTAEPLLSSSYYIQRALAPFADVRLAQGDSPADAVTHFLDQHLPMLILADVGNVAGDAHDRLAHWIEDGGVLVRFAGPRLAASDDDLVPVKLRRGGRILGGSLSWDKPQPLAAFSRDGPFIGMPVPNDVTVTRQVLAEPDATLSDNTWATLADGTPLVTAARRGKGLIVLFHVTGDTRWSDLPLSGSFVEMLKRIVALAGTTPVAEAATRKAGAVHEAVAAEPRARRLRRLRRAAADGAAGAGGFFRQRHRRSSAGLLRTAGKPACREYARGRRSPGAARFLAARQCAATKSIAPASRRICADRFSSPRWRCCCSIAWSFFSSAAASSGCSRGASRAAAATVIVLALLALTLVQARAQEDADSERAAVGAGNQARLCGHRRCRRRRHQQSRPCRPHALPGAAHRARAGDPIGLDIAHDELAFYPLIYWPIVPGAPRPSGRGAQAHRHLHEGRRHRAVRYPRRGGRAARPRRRDPQSGHAGTAQNSVLARHSPNSNRCRAITF